jgi:uncharacterized membrane protein
MTNKEGKSEALWSMASYLPFFNIIIAPIAMINKVKSELVLYHARHGLIYFIFLILSLIFLWIHPFFGFISQMIIIALHIVGAIAGLMGKYYKLPIISAIALSIPKYYIFRALTGKDPENSDL